MTDPGGANEERRQHFLLPDGRPWFVEESSGARTWHIYLGSQQVATVSDEPSGTPQTHFIIGNHLGYPEMVIDSTGNTLWYSDHLPFGETVNESGPEYDPLLRYPGQWAVPEVEGLGMTELFYNGYRWYRPDWGRYSQSDPIGLGGGTNSFVYAGNNPFKFLDPIGLAYFASRPLDGLTWFGSFSGGVFSNPALNVSNCLISHEQLFFEDGKQPTNMGLFFPGGGIGPDTSYPGNASLYVRSPGKYDDCIARMAAESMGVGGYYNLLGLDGIGPQTGPGPKWNCQDWGAEVRRRYAVLESIRQVREQCCKKKGKRLWDMGNITLRR